MIGLNRCLPMQISVTVMAHPRRKAQAEALHKQLAQYPFIDCGITWDQKNIEWHTGERALRAGITAGAEWHLVIQDDAILPADFYLHVKNACAYVPMRTLISLYTGTTRPLPTRVTAAVKKAKYCSWLRAYMLYWGVAIVIPTKHIEPMLEYAETRKEQYDTRIGIFYQRNILPVFYTNPSLVDHDDDIGSLLNHGNGDGRRVAHRFVDGPVRWNKQFVDI